jgi:hypothetical protein
MICFKLFLFLIIFLVLCSLSWAGRDIIPSTRGFCKDWEVYVDYVRSFDEIQKFSFSNGGIAAFKVKAIVRFYGIHNEYISSITRIFEGPVNTGYKVFFNGGVPWECYHMRAEIYYTDTFGAYNYDGEPRQLNNQNMGISSE